MVAAALPGRLAQVLVEEGDQVRQGQVLARLASEEYQARLQSAEASLAMAEADRTRLINGTRLEERREADAQRLQAETVLTQAENEQRRRTSLYQSGAIAQEEYERATRDLQMAKARRDELAERATVVSAPARADERARADAAVAVALAQAREARVLVEKTAIRAPSAGRILRRLRQAGEMVSLEGSQHVVFVLGDLRHLRVRAEIDETDVARVAVGQRGWVQADAYGGQRFEGRIVRVGEMLGRKQIRTDEPTERNDVKVLEVLLDLEPGVKLPIGLRVDVFVRRDP